jgi:DnaK suppressor protein
MVLTAEQQEALRRRLTAEHDKITADLSGLDAEIVTLGLDQQVEGSVGNHIADDATDIMEQERDLAMMASLRERVRDIEHALARLEAGVYGQCERCGEPIGAERLEVRPFATLCIGCQTLVGRQRRPVLA